MSFVNVLCYSFIINMTYSIIRRMQLRIKDFFYTGIIMTAGFLEYLNEMVWAIISLEIRSVQEPENAVKLSHCMAALKIFHAFSIDKSCVKEMVSRGVAKVILCLLVSLMKFVKSTQTRQVFSFNREDSILETDEKESHNKVEAKKHLDFEDDSALLTPFLVGNLQFDHVTSSNDNIFYEEDEVSGIISNREHHLPKGRRRADSYIVRVDTRQRSESRHSVFERSISMEQNQPQPPQPQQIQDSESNSVVSSTFTPSRRSLQLDDVANHQQIRRISRSMSVSLQFSKSAVDEEPSEILPGTEEVIKQMAKHSVMFAYHIMENADEETLDQIHSMHFIPILYNVLSCFDESHKFQLGLPISATIMQNGGTRDKGIIIMVVVVVV